MRKTIRPNTATLPYGSVLPEEFAEVLRLAATNATRFNVSLWWKDGYKGKLNTSEQIDAALEDPENFDWATGHFYFADDESLDLHFASYTRTVQARGQQATANQSAIVTYLTRLPGMSRMSSSRWILIKSGIRGLMGGALTMFLLHLGTGNTPTALFWWLSGIGLVAAILAETAIRTSAHERCYRKRITYRRPSRWDASTSSAVASALATVGALAVAIYAAGKG